MHPQKLTSDYRADLPPGVERADRIGPAAGRNILLESLDRALDARAHYQSAMDAAEQLSPVYLELRRRRDEAIQSIESLERSAEKLGLTREAKARIDAAERRAVIAAAERRCRPNA